MLLVSDLPNIFWNTFFGREPEWLSWAKVALLAVFLALCLIWKRTRALWRFSFMILVLYLAFRVSAWVGDSSWWRSQFGGPQVSFTVGHLGIQLRDWGVTLVIIAALWMIKRRRDEFFLARGQLDAPVEPVRWLGIGKGASWATFGWIFSLCISLGTLMFVVIAGRPSPEMLVQLIPLLPAVLLIAAMNAFSEEMSYRASLLATLHEVVGKQQALLITAVMFGLAHYLYGTPSGVIGFLMTGFVGWLWGKSMLETKGLFWAWLIHFLQDVMIFAFAATRSV
jgi:membrane protease YdiL (CAAX protease family)